MKIQLKRSNVLVDNNARQPTPGQMEYGELAVNYNNNDPAIFIKDSNNNIVRIAGKYNIADDGQVELPSTPTPPSDPKAGNLWYNNTDGRLYIYFTDADSSQWVDASPDSWDPSSYPDVTDDTAQSGTLDDRYLMLNAANDPLTSDLTIAAPNPVLRVQDTDGTNQYSQFLMAGAGTYIENRNDTTAGPIIFRQFDGSVQVEKMRINTNGFVGIGTNSPATTLDVDGSIYFSSRLRSTSGGTAANPSIQPGNDADTGIFHPSETNTIGFTTTGVERIRISSSGAVGIGAFPPQSLVHAEGDRDYTGTTPGLTSYDYNLGSGTAFVGIGQSNGIPTIQGHGAGTSYKLLLNPNAGNVGIGTDNPDVKLHVEEGTTEANDTPEVKISSFRPTIRFEDKSASSNSAEICGDNSLIFRCSIPVNDDTALVEHMRINALGNVGIGTNDPAVLLDLKSNDPRINLTDTDAGGIFQIRNTSGAGYVTTTGASPIVFSTNSSEKLRILSGGGITFNGDTSSLNALDDYEEGTFVPTFISTGTNPSVVYGTREGYYTKIGNVVYFTFTMTVTTVNSVGTGNLQVTGFPVDALNNNNQRAGGFVGYAVNWVEAQGAPASWLFANNTNSLTFYRRIADGTYLENTNGYLVSGLNATANVRCSGFYYAGDN